MLPGNKKKMDMMMHLMSEPLRTSHGIMREEMEQGTELDRALNDRYL